MLWEFAFVFLLPCCWHMHAQSCPGCSWLVCLALPCLSTSLPSCWRMHMCRASSIGLLPIALLHFDAGKRGLQAWLVQVLVLGVSFVCKCCGSKAKKERIYIPTVYTYPLRPCCYCQHWSFEEGECVWLLARKGYIVTMTSWLAWAWNPY
jgi:hypothetical protein